MSNDEQRLARILDQIQNYREARVIMTFAELGIGEALTDRSMSIDVLARAVGSDPSGLKRFLAASSAFGLVEIGADDYVKLTEAGFRAFSPESDENVVNAVKLEAAFFERWSRLTRAVRSGRRPEENRQQEDDPGWVPMFTNALHERSRETTKAVAKTISAIFPEAQDRTIDVLDLGGGHGGYSIELARANPSVKAVVFDLPPVIESTVEIIGRSGVEDRVAPVAGDFHTDDIGSDYDFILLFGVLHGETTEGASTLLTAIRKALAPDGRLLIRSQGRGDRSRTAGERELFDLHILLSTEGGSVHKGSDTQRQLAEHGFVLESSLEIEFPGSGEILVFKSKSG
jgi:SAM-dependent methyltransferase